MLSLTYLDGADRGQVCLIHTGTYTGDGTVDQYVQGLGFEPIDVRVLQHVEFEAGNLSQWVKTDQMFGTLCHVFRGLDSYIETQDNRLTALDVDGFHVDDNGLDQAPNADGFLYIFTAWGY